MTILVGLFLLAAAVVGIVIVLRRYRAERSEVQRVRALFSRYVTPAIVEELLRRKDPRLYTGRSMHATIVVCRIWNFAGFSEALTPEETLRYLNEFYAIAGTTIQKHRGMIDKFLSDGIIGVFGVPLEDPFQEEHALKAALDIVRLVAAMDKRWQAQGRRSIHVGIGINSGSVIAGDAGYNERREFTVVGPETLLAARLQEATIDLNASIVAASATCDVVSETFTLVPIKGVPLPGLKRLADAFIVLGLKKYDQDTLKMPDSDAFVETKIDEPARARATTQAAPPAAAPLRAEARLTPPPPEVTPMPSVELPDPPQPLRPRRRVGTPSAGLPASIDLPELRIPRYRSDDEGPIMPDPPPPRAVYEDGEGPPMQLPP